MTERHQYKKPSPEPRRPHDDVWSDPPIPTGERRTRSASARPSTWNAETRTVEAIVSTGAGVMRRDSRGPFVEALDLSSIDPSTLVDVPVLDGHMTGSVRHTIGVVVSARHEPEGLVAVLRIGLADDIEPIAARIAEGLIRNVSIGYVATSERESLVDGRRVKTVIPFIREISLVVNGADPGAKLRTEAMEPEDLIEPTEGAEAAKIRSLGELARKPDEWAESIITRGLGVDDARALIHAESMEAAKVAPRIRTATVGTDHTDPNEIRRRAEGALVSRMEGSAMPEESREFAGLTLSGVAASLLIARGEKVRHGENPETILTRAAQHGVSDFPQLLTGAGSRVLMNAYSTAQSPLVSLCRRGSHTDFRGKQFLRLGGMGELSKVSESGEIKSVSRGEATEGYSLDTYGAMFSLSRKALVNDDLNAFADFSRAAAQAAAATEANLLVSMLTQANGAGPLMGDAKRMFVAGHGNTGTPGAGELVDLGTARLAMRRQVGLDTKTPIKVTPKYWVIAPEYERIAEQIVAEITPAKTEDVTGFARELTLLVEPRLSGNSWYLFADPASLPCFELGYLASAPGPQMSTRDGWDTLGREFRVTLDVGVGALDWHGAYFLKAA